jgi:hypothetical protein
MIPRLARYALFSWLLWRTGSDVNWHAAALLLWVLIDGEVRNGAHNLLGRATAQGLRAAGGRLTHLENALGEVVKRRGNV